MAWVFFWGMEKQRLGVSSFYALSLDSDEVIGTILQNSLANVLQKEQRFNVVIVTQVVTNLSHARESGMREKVDMIIYGTYKQEGRTFIVSVGIYDILENEVRMSRVYRGEYSRNIFDTVDMIAYTITEEVKRVLPALVTEEDIARTQAKRKEIYEPQEVTFRREMRIGVGMCFTTANWLLWRERFFGRWEGSTGITTFLFSLSARIEMFRLNFEKVSLMWVPAWYSMEGSSNWREGETIIPPSTNDVVLHREMRNRLLLVADGFIGKAGQMQFFGSIGVFGVEVSPFLISTEDSFEGGVLFGGGVFGKNWEFSCLVQLWPLTQGWRDSILGLNTDIVEYYREGTTTYQYNFPFLSIGGSYFFTPAFGVTTKISWMDTQRIDTRYEGDSSVVQKNFRRVSVTDFSVEMVYRFQFGF